jgi:hypothetical protein
MKQNLKPVGGDGPERDELRAMLWHWPAPQTPPEIEGALRREVRRRRSRPRKALRISLAAAATLIVAWRMISPDLPVVSRSAEAPVAAVPSPAAPLLKLEPDRVAGSPPAVADPGRARRQSTSGPKQPEVVVEPDQAALLAELGRKLSGTRQAIPGTAIPQMPEVEVPRYLEEWQTVAGEWPFVQESDAIGGR